MARQRMQAPWTESAAAVQLQATSIQAIGESLGLYQVSWMMQTGEARGIVTSRCMVLRLPRAIQHHQVCARLSDTQPMPAMHPLPGAQRLRPDV